MQHIGIIGLAAMGSNLAKNFASKGVTVSVYNRTFARTQSLTALNIPQITGYSSLWSFVKSIPKPRTVILLVQAGFAVDDIIRQLYPLLDSGDTLVDMGNSYYKDTERRQQQLARGHVYDLQTILSTSAEMGDKSIHFVGCGISGGEMGALHGPSLMPGGSPKIVDQLVSLLEKIAARDFADKPCVTNVGLGGAGHFVKMVHNGIEYALMQGIAEIYDILRHNDKTNFQIQHIFSQLNTGQLQSFLLDIVADILDTKIEDGKYLVDLVGDKAGSKGTGGWTMIASAEYAVPTPNIAAAVYARMLSDNARTHSSVPTEPTDIPVDIEVLHSVLAHVFSTSFAQGFALITAANTTHKWDIFIDEVTRIWQGGCIIRCQMLNNPTPKSPSALSVSDISAFALCFTYTPAVPKPVLSATKEYLLTQSASTLPTNLIQSMRDYFGAHTYLRTDTNSIQTGGWNSQEAL